MEDHFSEFTICASCSESITHVKWSNHHLSIFFSIILWYFDKNTYSQPNSLTGNSICYHITEQYKLRNGGGRNLNIRKSVLVLCTENRIVMSLKQLRSKKKLLHTEIKCVTKRLLLMNFHIQEK